MKNYYTEPKLDMLFVPSENILTLSCDENGTVFGKRIPVSDLLGATDMGDDLLD